MPMPALLILALVIVPLAELAIIIEVGRSIGVAWTIALLLVNSLLGAWLLQREGRRAWSQFRTTLTAGRWPGDEVAQGGLIIFGGALLLTPGFLTDVVGFLCLLPPTRAVASRVLRSRATGGIVGGGAGATSRGATGRRATRSPADGDGGPEVLDVEVLEVRRDDPDDLTDGSQDASPR